MRENKVKKLDIHCHVLPGLDDGASDRKESLAMLKEAYRQGICTLIASSHASFEFPESFPDAIRRSCQDLEKAARETIAPDIRIYPGQEILFTDSVLEKLEQKELLTMAGSSYVLLEFFPGTHYSVIYRAVREFAMAEYHPILAHIERYEALRQEGRVEELIRTGAYTQMNYRIIGGHWYDSSVRWCRRMLKNGNIHFLGTDMHNMLSRPPRTEAAEQWLRKNLDETYVRKICRENAEKLIDHANIE